MSLRELSFNLRLLLIISVVQTVIKFFIDTFSVARFLRLSDNNIVSAE